MKKIFAAVVILILVLAAAACSPQEESSPPAAGGVETNSGNEEHPPPNDINGPPQCTNSEITGPSASGTLTNNSSGLSGYMISVGFLDATGTRVADGTAIVNNVQAGQTANWEAQSFAVGTDYATCEIVSVDRLAQ